MGPPTDGFRDQPLTLRENHNVAPGGSQNHGDEKIGLPCWEFNTNKPEHSLNFYLAWSAAAGLGKAGFQPTLVSCWYPAGHRLPSLFEPVQSQHPLRPSLE